MKNTAKYFPLYKFLKRKNSNLIRLTKKQIREILGFNLPKSSETNTWWTNSPENGHYHAYAWVDAGFEAKISNNIITFVKQQ